jgi:hypothetical protein
MLTPLAISRRLAKPRAPSFSAFTLRPPSNPIA